MHTNPFSTEAAEYAHLRPTYPDELFAFLATVAPSREVAWDCATGNGQAATHLAGYFERVIATDESGEMIAQAPRDTRIVYRVAEAEDSGLEGSSVDLVTVAAAIHWFDLERFYAEVRRVAKQGAAVAAWTYYTPVLATPSTASYGVWRTTSSGTTGTSACTTLWTSSTTCPSLSSRSWRLPSRRT